MCREWHTSKSRHASQRRWYSGSGESEQQPAGEAGGTGPLLQGGPGEGHTHIPEPPPVCAQSFPASAPTPRSGGQTKGLRERRHRPLWSGTRRRGEVPRGLCTHQLSGSRGTVTEPKAQRPRKCFREAGPVAGLCDDCVAEGWTPASVTSCWLSFAWSHC